MKQKKIILIFLVLVILLGLTGTVCATDDYYTETKNGTTSYNVGANEYVNILRWATTVNSYLYTNSDGTLTRVEYINNKVIIEKYDSAFNFIEKKEIPMELKTFGGFYSGSDYNFLVFGQTNTEESDEFEIARVVKYSKDWKRLGALSLKGENTYIIFEAGSCRMTENNGVLFIDTCHKMYKSEDGYRHQANMLIKVNEANMELQYCRSGVMNYDYNGYASHSFNQYIETDGEYIYSVDHGDAYPRGVAVCKIPVDKTLPISSAIVLKIQGSTGDNDTGVSVGGSALSANNVFIVGNSVDQSNSSNYNAFGIRNIFLTTTPTNNLSTSTTNIKWLTNYTASDNITVKNPQIVKVNDNKFLVMWEEYVDRSPFSIKAVLIDGNGKNLSKIISFNGRLSDCQPIIYNNKVTWYTTASSSPTFYALDVSTVSNFEKYNKLPFIDIKEKAFYMNALKDLYTKGYVTGTSKTTFSPNDNLSRAMLVTILWNMEGRPKVSGTNKFSDVKNGAWYTDAIVWASTNKVVNGNKDGTFTPNNNITRQEVAVMLCNYAKYKGKDITSNKDLSTFKDNNKVANWAMPAIRWSIENRVIGGAENGTKINPRNNATRGEAVTMIKNYIDNIK